MQDEINIDAVVEYLLSARTQRRTLRALPAHLRPRSTLAGYRIQQALTKALAEQPSGWKIACTNPAAQELMGTHEPFAGPLFDSMLHLTPARLSGEQFNMRMVEGEFAFRLARDLPARAEHYQREEVEAAIECVHPAIEIADSRFDDWLCAGVPSLIADGAVSGAFVYGEGVRDWQSLDLVTHRVSMRVNRQVVGKGCGAGALGDSVLSLLWLANKQSQLGDGLGRGQIVTTGTCTGNYQAGLGDDIVADFAALGEIRVRFDPP